MSGGIRRRERRLPGMASVQPRNPKERLEYSKKLFDISSKHTESKDHRESRDIQRQDPDYELNGYDSPRHHRRERYCRLPCGGPRCGPDGPCGPYGPPCPLYDSLGYPVYPGCDPWATVGPWASCAVPTLPSLPPWLPMNAPPPNIVCQTAGPYYDPYMGVQQGPTFCSPVYY